MTRTPILEADADRTCDCCLRTHRKLYLVDSHWLGANCKEAYWLYRNHSSDVTSLTWRGYERKHAQVLAMLHAVVSPSDSLRTSHDNPKEA